MTGRERFLSVFNGEMPERVLVTQFIVEQGNFITQVYLNVASSDYKAKQLKVIEFQKKMGCDVFVKFVLGVNDPMSIHYGGIKTNVQAENWEVNTISRQSGNTTIYHSEIKTPEGFFLRNFQHINHVRVHLCIRVLLHRLKVRKTRSLQLSMT